MDTILLETAAADPAGKPAGRTLLTDAEYHQLIFEWNKTEVEYPKGRCLHELIEEQAGRTPEAVAVVFGERRLTYRQLNGRANQLARYLQRLGVGPDSLAGICVERSLEMVIGLLGILKAGGAYVPLDPKHPKERLVLMLEDSGVTVLLTQAHLAATLPAVDSGLVRLDADWPAIARESGANVESAVVPQNLAYVLFTSGSTGRPKGVAIEHRSTVALVTWARQVFTKEEFAGVLFSTSICFDLSVFELFATLANAGKVILVENALALPALPAASQVRMINTVPSAMAELARTGGIPDSVVTVNLAGEPLAQSLVEKLYEHPSIRKVYDLYGPTETTTYSTFTLRERGGKANIGRPIANTQVYLLDRNRQPVSVGVPGELFIGGAGLARGYHKRPELTVEKFIANPFSNDPGSRLYQTGDLARYLPDGQIEYVGRIDHQVKIRGYRVELGEIEEVLNQHGGVLNSVAVAREDKPGNQLLVAYLVSRNGPISSPALREFVRARLPDYMVPAAFVMLPALPLNSNGKVDRQALPRPEFEPTDKSAPPATPTEVILAGIWCEVLGLKQVGIHDNFFDLGGHSLLAVQLIGRINQSLNLNLPIPVFFQNPTIGELATNLDRENHTKREPKLIQLQPGRSGGTLFLLDISMGLCRLAQNLEGVGPAIYGTVVPLSGKTFQAASSDQTDKLPTLQELAAAHTALIQSHAPSGPCLLAGHSFDGLLAFEVAHQLQQMGREVKMVFLLDSWATRPAWWKKFKILTLARVRKSLRFRAEYLWSKARNKMRRLFQRSTSASPPDAARDADPYKINHPIGDAPWEIWEKIYRKAWKHYKLIPLESRAVLFRAQHNADVSYLYPVHPNLGWDGLFKNGLRMMEIPGNHLSLLKEPQVITLAGQFKIYLEELSDSGRAHVNSLSKKADEPAPLLH